MEGGWVVGVVASAHGGGGPSLLVVLVVVMLIVAPIGDGDGGDVNNDGYEHDEHTWDSA